MNNNINPTLKDSNAQMMQRQPQTGNAAPGELGPTPESLLGVKAIPGSLPAEVGQKVNIWQSSSYIACHYSMRWSLQSNRLRLQAQYMAADVKLPGMGEEDEVRELQLITQT